MPYPGDRAARLFYDDACGPCRLFARASEAVSHHRVVAAPLSGSDADARLAGLSAEARFGSAHLDAGRDLRTGDALALPLVGLTLGPRWERIVRRIPPAERALRRAYLWLWEYRRTRGCAAPRAT